MFENSIDKNMSSIYNNKCQTTIWKYMFPFYIDKKEKTCSFIGVGAPPE